MSQSLPHILVLIGVWNFVVLALTAALEIRKSKSAAWALAFFAALASGLGAITVAHQSDGVIDRVAWSGVQSLFLLGPALYGYRRSLAGTPLRSGEVLFHLGLAGTIGIAAAASGAMPLLLTVQPLAYVLASLRIEGANADRSAMRLLWLMTCTMVAMIAADAARLFNPDELNCDLASMTAAAASGVLLMLVLVSRPFAGIAARYSRSGLDEARLRQVWESVRTVLIDQRLYLRPDLSLDDLAHAAGVLPRHATQALSVVGKTSFNDLLARVRVEDAKMRLAAPENGRIAIEPIGMEAGFRSRSAFYAAFRRATGLTPAQYRAGIGNLSWPRGEDSLPGPGPAPG